MTLIDAPSAQALPIEARFENVELGQATGFVVQSDKGPLLVTNWHVVSGRHLDTRRPVRADAALPDRLVIRHNLRGQLGAYVEHTEPLYDVNGAPLWLEHATLGSTVDVVALPLTQVANAAFYPLNPSGEIGLDNLPEALKWGASTTAFVLGFPFGWKGAGDLAIWAQGIIATEPELNFRNLPRFLLDSRTRKGQSGSPVVLYHRGGGFVQLAGGKPYMLWNPRTLLLGVYSGRLSEDSDLGTVWKASIVADIAARGLRGNIPAP